LKLFYDFLIFTTKISSFSLKSQKSLKKSVERYDKKILRKSIAKIHKRQIITFCFSQNKLITMKIPFLFYPISTLWNVAITTPCWTNTPIDIRWNVDHMAAKLKGYFASTLATTCEAAVVYCLLDMDVVRNFSRGVFWIFFIKTKI